MPEEEGERAWRCQKRKVKMSPMPNPMIHATKRNVAQRSVAKCLRTLVHSGSSLSWLANTLLCGEGNGEREVSKF